MADWQNIKTEYITTDTSYRKLAQKYGLDQATIAQRGKKEDWVGIRKQKSIETQAKIIDAVEDRKVDRAAKLLDVADLLMEKVRQRIEAVNALAVGSQELRCLSSTLKDLKEVQMIRSDADRREQEARIKNLQKQAEAEEKRDNTIVIQFAEGSEEYAK